MNTNQLTSESVSKLFFRYLIPSIMGMMVTSIYILADTIIIGKGIGIDAMAALNIVLPLFNIFFGNGLLFGVGGSVLMAIARGKGDKKSGECYFTVATILNLITCAIYTMVFLIYLKPIVKFLGATDATMPYILDYAPYVIAGLSVFAFSTFFQTFVRNDGAPKLAMAAVITGGISNVILDIIFVYPLNMGMKGASIASVIGSGITVTMLLTHFLSPNNGLRFTLKGFSTTYIIQILSNGFTSFLVDVTSGIVMFIFNIKLLKVAEDTGVSMYGVICNTAIIVICLCNGITQAAQPIISTNHGAGLKERIVKVRSLGMKTSFAFCAVPTLIALVFPNLFTYIFLNPNEEILAMSPTAIRIYFIGFLATGINMFVVGYFQSIARPTLSLILCLLRGCVLSIFFVLLLTPIWGIVGIWSAVPLAEFITLFVAIYFLHRTRKEKHA